jgi:hypothetical protein
LLSDHHFCNTINKFMIIKLKWSVILSPYSKNQSTDNLYLLLFSQMKRINKCNNNKQNVLILSVLIKFSSIML